MLVADSKVVGSRLMAFVRSVGLSVCMRVCVCVPPGALSLSLYIYIYIYIFTHTRSHAHGQIEEFTHLYA